MIYIKLFNKNFIFFLYVILIIYLLINTGIFSDDFDAIARLKGRNLKDVFSTSYFIDTPVEYLSHYIWYYFFQIDNLVLVNLIKIFYIILSFYLITQFFNIYLEKFVALWASFLFVFFPTHDSTVYFFMGQYLTLSFALYLYSFYLAYRNRLFLAFLSALFASFISYGSTPLAVGLFILFILSKELKKGMVMLIPNVLYLIYFVPLNIVMRSGYPRIIEKFSIIAVIKQFILQILTFFDAMLGPSMWLKIYYSFWQISPISFIIGMIAVIVFYKISKETERRYDSRLVISFTVLLFSSFLMFAFTGRYPQLAFNLGNRVTIYGSLLFAYLIVLMPVSKKIRVSIFAISILTALGISDHWKSWNIDQQKVVANIKHNYELKNYHHKDVIYVSGNQYSRYGAISHIEFFSENWVPSSIFKLVLGESFLAKSLNKRHKYIDGYLIDTKYEQKDKVTSCINVYDSEKNILFELNAEEINNYIDALPADNRHWVQILNLKLLKDIVLRLMPRLKYAL